MKKTIGNFFERGEEFEIMCSETKNECREFLEKICKDYGKDGTFDLQENDIVYSFSTNAMWDNEVYAVCYKNGEIYFSTEKGWHYTINRVNVTDLYDLCRIIQRDLS